MNPQPSNFVGFLGLVVFAAMVLFYFFKEIKFPTRQKSFLDTIVDKNDIYFPIGYIIEQRKPTPIVEKKKSVPKPTKKVEISPEPVIIKSDNKFSEEAISGLVNLGFKKKEAQRVVENVIKNSNPSSVEELIRKCFAR